LKDIPQNTIETLVRSFFKESSAYGFQQLDYIRFVNMLLDMSMSFSGAAQQENNVTPGKPRHISGAKNNNLPLAGKGVIIRKFEPERDTATVNGWLTDKQGAQFLLSRSTAQADNFGQLAGSDSNIFGMITSLSEEPIGCMAFLDVDPVQQKAELRKLIGNPQMRGRGYAKEATGLWVDYGLEALQLKKIYLSTLDTNIRNIKLNEDLGFKIEGILRNEILYQGEYRDVLRMGLWNG